MPNPAPGGSDLAQQLHAMRQLALAVAGPGGPALFDDLVHALADALAAPAALIAVFADDSRARMRTLAVRIDGQPQANFAYDLEGTPCAQVVGRSYRYVARGVAAEFPADAMFAALGVDSYAAYPLTDGGGAALGLIAAMDRQPIGGGDPAHAEAMLKIVAVRAAAELERRAAGEALARSEASYRAIFEAAEDSIFIHDWASGRILDVNRKACETYGWSREEFRRLSVADISAGMKPYTVDDALRWIQLAKIGRCPPFEWRRRNKDGSLHWDEVRLKPATIEGRPHILAFTRDITAHKEALAALEGREQQYRAIFETASDGFILWDEQLTLIDANPAALRMFGYARDAVLGQGAPAHLPPDYRAERLALIRRAMAGETVQVETRALRADGSSFDVDLRVMPFNHRGRPHVLAVARDISEQRERERALERSEARLRATVEAAFDAVVGMDGEGRIVEFNAAAERTFGHRREDVLGRLLANLILPHRHRDAHTRGLKHFHTSGRGPMVGRLVETSALRADGSEFPVELAISVAKVPEGSIFVGHLRDITERRRADQALRDSEEQYRAIFNAAADALVLRDAAFRIVDVNATYESMSGYTRREVLGVDRILANPDERAAEIRALHERALAGTPVVVETELVRRDGHRYALELRGVPTRYRGEPHVLYMGRDITERKRADLALRDSEEQYRAIFNASADALVLRDAEYRAVDVNPAYLAITGFGRDEVLQAGRVLTQPDPALRDLHRRQHDLVLAGQALRFESHGQRKDGATLLLEIHAMPVQYRGQPHVLYAARDITERRQAEAQRVELERQLRQAQKMEAIGQLTGGIAHDFNNILTSVVGWLAIAQERAGADGALERPLAQARLAADRARALIAQMLAFARRQRGQRQTLALAPLARRTLGLLRATLPASVTLEPVGLDEPALHAAAGSVALQVDADPVQLEQVLFNLCINARDAMQGRGRLRVTLRADRATPAWHCASCRAPVDHGRWAVLAVADEGSGIAPDLLERIFDPFFSTKAPGSGSGMGLAMVHGIVHEHGGHVALQTMPGEGACFEVWLPLSDAAGAAAPAAVAAPAVGAALHGHVLLVEDDPMVGEYLAEQLAAWGLAVDWQREAPVALGRLQEPTYPTDLLLTDQTMPRLTGLQLATQAHALRPALPIVLISGNAEAFDAAALEAAGVAGSMAKPLDAARLRTLLARWLAAPAPAPATRAGAAGVTAPIPGGN